jgi:hypothetical protein
LAALRRRKSNPGPYSIRNGSGGTNGVYHGRGEKIVARFVPPYRKAAKCEKSRILDEYFTLPGAKSRKYAIELFGNFDF